MMFWRTKCDILFTMNSDLFYIIDMLGKRGVTSLAVKCCSVAQNVPGWYILGRLGNLFLFLQAREQVVLDGECILMRTPSITEDT